MDSGLTSTAGRFRIGPADPRDDAELRELGRRVGMPGKIRFVFDREPGYFDALKVEGREAEVHVCREIGDGRIVGCAHRCFKPVYLNGEPADIGYLGGLRLEEPLRGGRLLARAFRYLRGLDRDGRVPFHLTSIMEDNAGARRVLASGRGGLPVYHDRGRFEAMAVGMKVLPARAGGGGGQVRPATPDDARAVLDFLAREGPRRQFYPVYRADDFGADGKLLYGLAWEDVMLAFRGGRLTGVAAAWDQRRFRQWKVTGYAPPLGLLRGPLNLWARFKGLPPLPAPGESPRYFTLALTCVENDDPAVFADLLGGVIRARRNGCAFFLAGLHEADPLLPVLRNLPHVPLPGRLYLVEWPDRAGAVSRLDPTRVPYLELGSL